MKHLQQKIIEFRDARNWKQFHTPVTARIESTDSAK